MSPLRAKSGNGAGHLTHRVPKTGDFHIRGPHTQASDRAHEPEISISHVEAITRDPLTGKAQRFVPNRAAAAPRSATGQPTQPGWLQQPPLHPTR